jgi:hypothetical protein
MASIPCPRGVRSEPAEQNRSASEVAELSLRRKFYQDKLFEVKIILCMIVAITFRIFRGNESSLVASMAIGSSIFDGLRSPNLVYWDAGHPEAFLDQKTPF